LVLACSVTLFTQKGWEKILIGDNRAGHLSANIIRHCEENNIAFVFLSLNGTHLCQPLDVALFHPVKTAWRKILLSWKLKNKGVLPKTEFSTMLQKLLNELGPNLPDNIKSGFSGSGILPLNRQKVLGKLIPSGRERLDEGALNNSFVEIMNKQTAVSATPPKTRKKKIDVPAGKSISSIDLESEVTDPQPGSSNDPTQILSETEEDCDIIENESAIENSDVTQVKIPIQDCNMLANKFIVASFVYNEGTKKESTKYFVAKVLKIISKNEIKIDCLRPFKEYNHKFIQGFRS
jgi:hypothetical protein